MYAWQAHRTEDGDKIDVQLVGTKASADVPLQSSKAAPEKNVVQLILPLLACEMRPVTPRMRPHEDSNPET